MPELASGLILVKTIRWLAIARIDAIFTQRATALGGESWRYKVQEKGASNGDSP